MSRYARTKGHSFERSVAQEFREMGFDCMTKRAARGGDWSHTDDGTDLVGTEPFAVQTKRLANYVSVNTIEEIKPSSFCPPKVEHGFARRIDERERMNCGHPPENHPERVPILLTKANGKPTMAVLPWDDLKRMIKELYGS